MVFTIERALLKGVAHHFFRNRRAVPAFKHVFVIGACQKSGVATMTAFCRSFSFASMSSITVIVQREAVVFMVR